MGIVPQILHSNPISNGVYNLCSVIRWIYMDPEGPCAKGHPHDIDNRPRHFNDAPPTVEIRCSPVMISWSSSAVGPVSIFAGSRLVAGCPAWAK